VEFSLSFKPASSRKSRFYLEGSLKVETKSADLEQFSDIRTCIGIHATRGWYGCNTVFTVQFPIWRHRLYYHPC